MKERPILFSGPMVRAILASTKTQTRRVMAPQPELIESHRRKLWRWEKSPVDINVTDHADIAARYSPVGVPSDRLWVRETWREGDYGSIFYRADEEWDREIGWKPSIFMPRTHSRITLEVTGVRVERVQEISGADCRAEGIRPRQFNMFGADATERAEIHRVEYRLLWDSLNAKRGFGWNTDPWVWAIEFKRVT